MKNEKESNNVWFLVIGLLVFMICVTGATYAYFVLTASNNSITASVGEATLSLSVSKVIPTNVNKNMVPQLESTLGDVISSTYNCVDGNGNVVCQVYKATVTNTGSVSTKLNGTISFTNINNLPNLKWRRIADATTLGEYSSFKATSSEAIFEEAKLFVPTDSADYYFVFWIDEAGEAQTDSGTFRVTINFKSADGEGVTSTIRSNVVTGAAKTIQDLYNDGSTLTSVRIGGLETKPSVTLNANQGIMLDNNGEYRYYGADPNNYVTFNGELWRIIGVSTVRSSNADPVGERRVKIIRNDSIGSYSWDSSASTVNSGYGVNEWSQADLMTELNTLYYNKQSGTCYNGQNNASTTCDFASIGLSEDSKNLIDDALWYLGGTSLTDLYASDFYTYERGTTVWGSTSGQTCDDGACPRTTRWTGKVGLMYPSDYMYATDLSVCTGIRYHETDSSLDYRNTVCKNNDWLYKNVYQWTFSMNSINSSHVFAIYSSGEIRTSVTYDANDKVRPVVYLNSNVEISGGSGTSANPYTLSSGTE